MKLSHLQEAKYPHNPDLSFTIKVPSDQIAAILVDIADGNTHTLADLTYEEFEALGNKLAGIPDIRKAVQHQLERYVRKEGTTIVEEALSYDSRFADLLSNYIK